MVLAVSSAAMAQQDERKGFYLGAAVGSGKAVDACDKKFAAGQSASCSDSGTSWSALGGYQFNRNVALEAAYTQLGRVEFAGGEIKTTVWEASFLGGLPTSENFTIFGRLGYYSGKSKTTGVGAADTSNNGPLLGLTGQYELGRNFAVRLDVAMYLSGGAPAQDNSDWRVARVGGLWRFR